VGFKSGLLTLLVAFSAMALLFVAGGCTSAAPSVPPSSALNQAAAPKTTQVTVIAAAPVLPAVSGTVIAPPASPTSVQPLSVIDVVRKVGPSVVAILTERLDYSYYLEPVPSKGGGSGFIISSDGYIATNNHVVNQAKSIKVVLADGRILDAKVQGTDSFSDVAVIKINAQNLSAITFSDSRKLQIGQPVVAIGNAFLLAGGYTVTQGIVSALGRSIQIGDEPIIHDMIQTDAAINPGNSGGPLVTMNGEVIGINTAKIGGGENVGFAVSSARAEPVTAQIIKHGKIIWPWLGIDGVTLTSIIAADMGLPVKEGILVMRIYSGGPASRAGVVAKDIITMLGDTQVKTADELQTALMQRRVGEEVKITFIHDGKIKTANAVMDLTPEFY
jgi:serine protease Do